jgi:hypothetical protein
MVRSGAIFLLLAAAASGQIRVNFFEGEASLAGRQLQQNNNEPVPAGATVASAQSGRVELFLARNVYFRLGNQSSARVISATEIELTAGAAIFDSVRAATVPPFTIRVRNAAVRINSPGDFNIAFDPPRLAVSQGQADVTMNGQTNTVKAVNSASLGTGSASPPPGDTLLDIWSTNRRILLSSLLSGSAAQPEQPLHGPDNDVTAGSSSSIGALPFSIYPYDYPYSYIPLEPYRPGSQFYGPSSSYWFPYYRYPAPAKPYIHPVPSGIYAGPRFEPAAPDFDGGAGLHIPGPVVGH